MNYKPQSVLFSYDLDILFHGLSFDKENLHCSNGDFPKTQLKKEKHSEFKQFVSFLVS